LCGFAALSGFLLLNTLYLQNVRGFSPLDAGLSALPFAVMTVIFAPISGRLVGHRGTRLPLAIAGVTMTTAGLMLTGLTNTASIWWLLATYDLRPGFRDAQCADANPPCPGCRSRGRGRRGRGLDEPAGRPVMGVA
jgi:MFS family permease